MDDESVARGQRKAGENGFAKDNGLTIREYFAARALQGILSSFCYSSVTEPTERAVRMADALLEALQKST